MWQFSVTVCKPYFQHAFYISVSEKIKVCRMAFDELSSLLKWAECFFNLVTYSTRQAELKGPDPSASTSVSGMLFRERLTVRGAFRCFSAHWTENPHCLFLNTQLVNLLRIDCCSVSGVGFGVFSARQLNHQYIIFHFQKLTAVLRPDQQLRLQL